MFSHKNRCDRRHATWVLALLASLFTMLTAQAKPTNVQESEMRIIPAYCEDTQGFKYGYKQSPNSRRWENAMGNTFWDMHHYCWARININRANRPGIPKSIRFSIISNVIADYDYVLNKAPSDFILLPEIYTKKGEALLQIKQIDAAKSAFEHARALKPDYWPAYSQWAEYLISIQRHNEALKVVQEGLKYNSESRVLKEQWKLLGGKEHELPVLPDNQQGLKPAEQRE